MITDSLHTDSVIMKSRCVSSSSSGSLELIAQMHVHDIAVLTMRCNMRTSTMLQVIGAHVIRNLIARLATCSVGMSASSMPISHSRKLLGILVLLKMLQCKKH